jgi:acyl-homoserine lactone synthase
MIEVITGALPGESELLDQALRLRHSVFVEERGWESLRRADERETDQFDTRDTVHHIVVRYDKVVGYHRLNPTTRPHLLSDVHFHLCSRSYCRGPHVWEWTRYCVAREHRGGRAFSEVASALIIGAMEWGLGRGIQDVVLEYHPIWITRFIELGFRVEPLGLPTEIEGEPVVAVAMHYDDEALSLTRRARGLHVPALSAVAGSVRPLEVR